jgi:hypothetical protein
MCTDNIVVDTTKPRQEAITSRLDGGWMVAGYLPPPRLRTLAGVGGIAYEHNSIEY